MDDFQHGHAATTKVHLQATAKKGATVKITPSWDKKTVKVEADKLTGAFEFDLQVPSAGGPYTLTFDDGKKLVLENVMAGEVWFCSGQSNMEMPVKGWGQVNNYEQEVANATHPMVRLFQVERVVARSPQTNVPLGYTKGWVQCSPETVGEFSAAAYFFAREVSQKRQQLLGRHTRRELGKSGQAAECDRIPGTRQENLCYRIR